MLPSTISHFPRCLGLSSPLIFLVTTPCGLNLYTDSYWSSQQPIGLKLSEHPARIKTKNNIRNKDFFNMNFLVKNLVTFDN